MQPLPRPSNHKFLYLKKKYVKLVHYKIWWKQVQPELQLILIVKAVLLGLIKKGEKIIILTLAFFGQILTYLKDSVNMANLGTFL